MIRSLFSAISGLRIHQTFMDVVGNNIANVNTTGYKGARVTFEDLLSQTVQGPNGPSASQATVNPGQVGLGAQVSDIGMITANGNLQATQSPTDLAIQGDGFFVLSNGQGGQVYTRDGSFSQGANGALVSSSGLQVLGWKPDPTTGQINASGPLVPLAIPTGDPQVAMASTTLTLTGNLDARLDSTATTAASKQVQATVTVYDSLGTAHDVTLTFTKTDNASNSWSWAPTTTETGASVSGGGTISFNGATGAINQTNGAPPTATLSLTLANGATSPQSLSLSLGSLTQLAATSSPTATTDGQGAGTLTQLSVDSTGEVTGIYSNGAKRLLGQVALATFVNNQGLLRQGDNGFSSTVASGNAQLGIPGSSGRGAISSGYLEMSNVDLSQEFSNMILAERGFQASSRVITVSDAMLQELVNLKPQ